MSEKEQGQWNELMSFIKYKLSWDKEWLDEVMPDLKKMSLLELTRWAIRMDIIDA